MHDRRDERSDRGRSRHEHDRDGRDRRGGDCHGDERGSHEHHDGDCGGDRDGGQGRGPDTRFLQLEMSELLYAEAESVAKEAFGALLLEEAKVRLRERFGDQITGLAQLAVDELMQDVFASLDIEARIRERNRQQRSRRERLSGILGAGRDQGTEGECEAPEKNGDADGGPGSESEEKR